MGHRFNARLDGQTVTVEYETEVSEDHRGADLIVSAVSLVFGDTRVFVARFDDETRELLDGMARKDYLTDVDALRRAA